MYDYPITAWKRQRDDYYRFDQMHARTIGKTFAVTSDLTLAAAREYLRTLPANEEISMTEVGNCLGARAIKFLYPQAEGDILFVTACGAFAMGDTYYYVPASYDFASLMWDCYDSDDPVTAGNLLKLIGDYGV